MNMIDYASQTASPKLQQKRLVQGQSELATPRREKVDKLAVASASARQMIDVLAGIFVEVRSVQASSNRFRSDSSEQQWGANAAQHSEGACPRRPAARPL